MISSVMVSMARRVRINFRRLTVVKLISIVSCAKYNVGRSEIRPWLNPFATDARNDDKANSPNGSSFRPDSCKIDIEIGTNIRMRPGDASSGPR